MNNKAVQFYAELLKDICVDVDDKGLLTKVLPDGKSQAIKDTNTKIPYALPTSALLRNHLTDYTFFHPLSEHLNRGEPKMIQALRGWTVFHFCELAQTMAIQLMEAAANLDIQKSMNTKQAAFLKFVGEVDQKTVMAMGKVCRASDKSPSRRFLTISLTNATNTQHSWLRQANLSFPVLDGDDDEPPFEVKGLRKSDIRAIRGMMKYIYGTLWEMAAASDKQKVEIGSGNQIAPYFDSMVQTIMQLAELFRQKAKLHRKVLSPELFERCNAKLDWVEQLGNYEDYRKLIPLVDNEEVGTPAPETPQPPAAPQGAPSWALNAGGSAAAPQPLHTQTAPLPPPNAQLRPQASTGGVKSLADYNAEKLQQQQQLAQQNFDPYAAARGPYGQPTPQQQQQQAYMMQQQQMYGQQPGYGYGQSQPVYGMGAVGYGNVNPMTARNHQALLAQQQQQMYGHQQPARQSGLLQF